MLAGSEPAEPYTQKSGDPVNGFMPYLVSRAFSRTNSAPAGVISRETEPAMSASISSRLPRARRMTNPQPFLTVAPLPSTLLKRIRAENTPLGQEAEATARQGSLVPSPRRSSPFSIEAALTVKLFTLNSCQSAPPASVLPRLSFATGPSARVKVSAIGLPEILTSSVPAPVIAGQLAAV